VADGNTLESGLLKCVMNVVDLRRNCTHRDIVPEQYFGNAVGAHVTMPPVMSTNQVDSDSQAKPLTADKYESVLAAAARSVRNSTETFRADPEILTKTLPMFLPFANPKTWRESVESPEFNPQRDGAVFISSWRNMSMASVDFGGGRSEILMGSTVPLEHRVACIVDGPRGDGVMAVVRFPGDGFDRLQDSRLLDHIAPEALFWTALQ